MDYFMQEYKCITDSTFPSFGSSPNLASSRKLRAFTTFESFDANWVARLGAGTNHDDIAFLLPFRATRQAGNESWKGLRKKWHSLFHQ